MTSLRETVVAAIKDAVWSPYAQADAVLLATHKWYAENGPSDAMFQAYRRALKEYIKSVSPEDRVMKWNNREPYGWDVPDKEKATARFKNMHRAAAEEMEKLK